MKCAVLERTGEMAICSEFCKSPLIHRITPQPEEDSGWQRLNMGSAADPIGWDAINEMN